LEEPLARLDAPDGAAAEQSIATGKEEGIDLSSWSVN
jgi:hypothetical protein